MELFYEIDFSRSRRLFLICLVLALALSPLVLNWIDTHTDYTPSLQTLSDSNGTTWDLRSMWE